MAKPKMSTKTPDDAALNALVDYHGELIDTPNTPRLAIVELIVPEIKTRPGTGEQQATVQIVHLELAHGKDAEALERQFTRIHFDRTGNKSRPNPLAEETSTDTPLEGIDDSVE